MLRKAFAALLLLPALAVATPAAAAVPPRRQGSMLCSEARHSIPRARPSCAPWSSTPVRFRKPNEWSRREWTRPWLLWFRRRYRNPPGKPSRTSLPRQSTVAR